MLRASLMQDGQPWQCIHERGHYARQRLIERSRAHTPPKYEQMLRTITHTRRQREERLAHRNSGHLGIAEEAPRLFEVNCCRIDMLADQPICEPGRGIWLIS